MFNKSTVIDVAKDFSDTPSGRYLRIDGPTSGDVFREKHLIPALERYRNVVVDFDGVEGYGSSFLEEAFGGLIRERVVTLDEFNKRVSIVSKFDESLVEEIGIYVEQANSRLK